MLAEFAAMLLRRDDLARFLRPLGNEQQQWLAALVTRGRQLLAMLLAERQRRQITSKGLRPGIEAIGGPQFAARRRRGPEGRPRA